MGPSWPCCCPSPPTPTPGLHFLPVASILRQPRPRATSGPPLPAPLSQPRSGPTTSGLPALTLLVLASCLLAFSWVLTQRGRIGHRKPWVPAL